MFGLHFGRCNHRHRSWTTRVLPGGMWAMWSYCLKCHAQLNESIYMRISLPSLQTFIRLIDSTRGT